MLHAWLRLLGFAALRWPHAPPLFLLLCYPSLVPTPAQAGTKVKVTVKRVYQFLHEFCTALGATHTDLALKLFLQCALAAEGPGFASEFFSQGACSAWGAEGRGAHRRRTSSRQRFQC